MEHGCMWYCDNCIVFSVVLHIMVICELTVVHDLGVMKLNIWKLATLLSLLYNILGGTFNAGIQ